MSGTTKLLIALSLVAVIGIAFAGGFTLGNRQLAGYDDGLDTIAEVWDLIHSSYVDTSSVDSDNLTRAAIYGMMEALNDPYSSFLEPELYALGMSRLSGEFDGIGAYVNVDEDYNIIIVAPISGSPAEEAGILSGDIIKAINGEPIDDMSLEEAILKIRGPKGTSVTLSVLHEGSAEPVDLTIVRATVEVPSVEMEMRGDIALVTISQFDDKTAGELASIIQEINGNGADGIIVDLRGNSGGLLDAVVDVASYFITEGTIIKVVSNGEIIASYDAVEVEATTDLPMLVLVDEYSASGSEVFAGALQDHGRAIIAGTTTYGKGSVNILHGLADGSGLYLTTWRWQTPNGRLIEGQGIEPDVVQEDLTGEEEVAWALEYLKDHS